MSWQLSHEDWDAEIEAIIKARVDAHERSAQTRIGPSSMGTPCVRRLAYNLAELPVVNIRDKWRSTVGSAVHDWLGDTFKAWDAAQKHDLGDDGVCVLPWCEGRPAIGHTFATATGGVEHVPRFIVETKVDCGTIDGETIDGTSDVYDRLRRRVIDWKITGPKGIKDYHANGPGIQYETQVDIYGRGFHHAGFPVEHVAIVFLPMNGELSMGYYWSGDFDIDVANESFGRAREVWAIVKPLLPTPLATDPDDPALDTTDYDDLDAQLRRFKTENARCGYCPWFDNALKEAGVHGCPGDPSLRQRPPQSAEDYLGI